MQILQSRLYQNTTQTQQIEISQSLRREIVALLEQIYPDHNTHDLSEKVANAFWNEASSPSDVPRLPNQIGWSEKDTYVITYGGSLIDGEHKPLISYTISLAVI